MWEMEMEARRRERERRKQELEEELRQVEAATKRRMARRSQNNR